MKKSLIIALIATIIILLAFGTLWNGAMYQAHEDMNNSVPVDSPNRAGVDIGSAVNAGISTLVYPAAILLLGAFAILGLWMFARTVSGKKN